MVVRVGDETLELGTIQVDVSAPEITISPNPDGVTYDLNQVVEITCDFADTGSGLESVTCGSATGTNEAQLTATLDTSTPGEASFVVSATDAAGNVTTTTYTYTVGDTYVCDAPTDGATRNGDIWKCATEVNDADRTAVLSIIVTGRIDNTTQYRLRVASDSAQKGTLVKYSDGSISGQPLLSATPSGSRLDFTIDLDRVGVASGETLYWAAETQSGEKGKPSAGFLDTAPDTGYFTLAT